MLKSCIIIEDQPPAQRILQKYIADIGSLELKQTFNNALDAIPYLQQHSIDILFLDIHLPKISGMDFLKTVNNNAQVILTTAFTDYAIDSYEFNVVDYLLKPFSFQRFVKAVAKAHNASKVLASLPVEMAPTKAQPFFIKSGYDLIKIESSDIIYIQSDADYTQIKTKDKSHLSIETLKQWMEKLDDSFCQIHKSYIVNVNAISKIAANHAWIANTEKKIPIGRAFKEDFIKKLKV